MTPDALRNFDKIVEWSIMPRDVAALIVRKEVLVRLTVDELSSVLMAIDRELRRRPLKTVGRK